jgi:sugar lactone lactonase YvrE
MRVAFHLSVDVPKFFVTAAAAAAGLCFGALALSSSAAAQTPPIVIPQTINTIAGTGSNGNTGNGGLATAAELSSEIRAVTVDGLGNIYFVDGGNNEVREINAATGIITVIAGGGSYTASSGNVISGCGTNQIDEYGDGCLAVQTKLNGPRGLAVDKAGNLYIAGYNDDMIHKINAQTGMMTLIAGVPAGVHSGGTASYSGDGTVPSATNYVGLNKPRGVRIDNFGNIWIADTGNNVIRMVSATTGKISTAVGYDLNGTTASTAGYTGDNSTANTSGVELNGPTDIVFDSQNNAYIADASNHVIREVAWNAASSTVGTITTLIGNNAASLAVVSGTLAPKPSGWPGPTAATTPALGNPTKLAIDSYNNLYFDDSSTSVIYFYDASAQTILPIAGTYGYGFNSVFTGFTTCAAATDSLGDGCPALEGLFYQGSSALGMTIDGQNNLYITDPNDERLREVTNNLSFPSTAIGQTVTQTIQLHFAKADALAASNGVVLNPTSGDFSVSSAPVCAAASDTTSNCTLSIAFNPIAPGLRTATMTVTGVLSSRAFPLTGLGTGALTSFDPGTIASTGTGLLTAQGTALDAAGNLYIADTGNNRVVEITAAGVQTTIAGTGTAGYSGDGSAATGAKLKGPTAVAVSAAGRIYIADTGNNVVRAINPLNGTISTYAGSGGSGCPSALEADTVGDGCPATEATLKAPAGLTVSANGDLYIADTGNNLIRRVDFGSGFINIHAGTLSSVACGVSTDSYGDGCPLISAATVFNAPTGLASDTNGNLYVADSGDNVVRMLSTGTGLVTLLAGNGQSVFTGDGGPATAASLNAPKGIAVDAAGNLYIADTGNSAVRLVSAATGGISTLLGLGGTAGAGIASGVASELLLSSPSALTLDAKGDLAIADSGNNRIIGDNRQAALLAFGRGNVGEASLEQTATFGNMGNVALTFTNHSPYYSLTGDPTQDFTFDNSASTACASSIAIGANCTLGIAFDATVTGPLAETLTIPSNAVNQTTGNIQFTGTGVILVDTNINLVLTSPASGSLQYGQSAVFTATVTPATGGGTPTGTLTFSIDGVSQPAITLGSNDQATLTQALPVGNHTIGAVYSGDLIYAASHITLPAPVAQATTTSRLTVTPSAPLQGAQIVFTAQVASTTTGIPTGSVSFFAGKTLVGSGTLNATGVATFTACTSTTTVCSLAVGSFQITAVYSGDPNYATSTSAASTLTVNPIPAGMIVSMVASSVCVAGQPTVLCIPQGGAIQTTLTVTPMGNLTGIVTLSCAGLPASANCTFYPTTLNLGGNPNTVPSCTPTASASVYATAGTVCTTLTIATNVPPASLQSQARPLSTGGNLLALAALFPALFFAGFFTRRKRSLPWLMVFAVVLLAGLTLVSGCASNITQQPAGVTPVGSSTVTVTFTGANNVTQTQTLTLTVVAATPITAQLDLPAALPNAAAMQIGF